MVMCHLRFDLRNPAFAAVSFTDRYAAALDMCAWAEQVGFAAVGVSEHHASDDGYLPSPVVFCAAIAARTRTIDIGIQAVIAPLHHPVRLAEDLAVLDNISGGRLSVIVAGGYVADEYAMFGVPSNQRGARTETAIDTMRRAWAGEPFDFDGRTIRITPRPDRAGGPPILLGGSSAAAARRAARVADGYVPTTPESWEPYRAEMLALGKPDPGPCLVGPVIVTTFVAEDPDAAWEELVPYFLHETNAYAAWMEAAGLEGPYHAMTADELRAAGTYRVLTPGAYVDELRSMGDAAYALVHPMVGGVPPERAWEFLRLFEHEVLPAFRD